MINNSLSFVNNDNLTLTFSLDENPEDNHINLYTLVSFHSLASFLMWIKLLYFMRIFNETGKNIWLLRFSYRLSGENYYRLHLRHAGLPLHIPDCNRRVQ